MAKTNKSAIIAKLKYYEKTVFVSKKLSSTDLATEKNLLIGKRELITAGTAAKDLRLRDLKLHQRFGTDWKLIAPNTPRNEDN